MTKLVPHTTVMRFAVAPGDTSSIKFIDGMQAHWPKLPKEGDTLTVPFLVDPVTRQPVPVRVVQIVEMFHLQPPTIAVVVGRQH